MSIRVAGDLAILIEAAGDGQPLAVAEALRSLNIPGLLDIVPAARTVLVSARDRTALERAAEEILRLPPVAQDDGEDPSVILREVAESQADIMVDVVYDGEDLAGVAAHIGLSVDAVIAAHTSAEWRAAFGGFAPGFMYLTGGDPAIRVPRLDAPRTSVPAGSVALAGEYSAVYPSASPGGWRLIGRTAVRMWDTTRESPALVQPGDTVRFRAVRELVELDERHPALQEHRCCDGACAERSRSAQTDGMATFRALTILDPGLHTTVQDQGRPGYAAVGVSPSGAMDRGALARANRAVGNSDDAAGLETVLGGLTVRAETPLTVAVSGAAAEATGRAFALSAGETLRIDTPSDGLRSYLAVLGGIAADSELGSRSYDALSGLGPAPLRAGDRLSVGVPSARQVPSWQRDPEILAHTTMLRFVPGPRDDWFEEGAIPSLVEQQWAVGPASNRVGIRLEGAPLVRSRGGELPSEGMVRGSIQVPASGLPVVFAADHPITGGYPVIGTVIDADLDALGQLAPGDSVRFEAVDLAAPITFTAEIDGRRHELTVPLAVAAEIDRDLARGDESTLATLIAGIGRSRPVR